MSEPNHQKKVVFLGGGHAHALALRMLAMDVEARQSCYLISEKTHVPYSGMLPAYLAGKYSYDDIHIDLRKLANFAGAHFICDQVIGMDADQQLIFFQDRASMTYDVLSINTGSTPNLSGIIGAEHAIPVKPVFDFLKKWELIVARLEQGQTLKLALIGGGVAAAELALCIESRFSDRVKVSLFHQGTQILPNHNASVRKAIESECEKRGISVHLNALVSEVNRQGVVVGGKSFAADEVICLTQAEAASWLNSSGLKLSQRGFIEVNATLQSLSHPNVFASGDVADVLGQRRPKSGVYAVRMAPTLKDNILNLVRHQPLKKVRLQKSFLSLIYLGHERAVASKSWFFWAGATMWKLKDSIDRKFMRQFEVYPTMEMSAEPMQCAGCAAKVGSQQLRAAFGRLKSLGEPSLSEFDDGDDAAVVAGFDGVTQLQTVDYFPSFVSDAYQFALICVQHCFNDIYAMGATPHSAQMILKLADDHQGQVEDRLFEVISGVAKGLSLSGAKLLGGHTVKGEGLELGLVVNGKLSATNVWSKTNLKDGDALVLTKPLGTGVLLAADMQRLGRGRWLDECLAGMMQSHYQLMDLAKRFKISACTDVTGFGLAGHLIEMLAKHEELSVKLFKTELPFYTGFCELVASGMQSTSYEQNFVSFANDVENFDGQRGPFYEVLFDPQTSGGLVFVLPTEEVGAFTAELRQVGFASAVQIGEIQAKKTHKISIS